MINGVLASDDPVERSIVRYLYKLTHQNKRLKDHIEKTGAWAHMKAVDTWRPFDFYHYFCAKYQEKYRREYRQAGNIVRAYQRIEAFRLGNHISKKQYKAFIEMAFERYFNNINMPTIAYICSPKLFEHLMGEEAHYATPQEYHNLDQALAKENEKFEAYVNELN
jgi:hypothetical protein